MGMEVDGKWKAARAFSSLTLIFGGLALVMHVAFFGACCCCCKKIRKCCCCNKCKSSSFSSSSKLIRYCKSTSSTSNTTNGQQIIGTMYLLSSLCSSLSLLFLHSNACHSNAIFNLYRNKVCALSTGAKCTYGAMGLWFVASSLVLLVGGETDSERRRRGGDEEEGEEGEDVVEDASVNSMREPLIQDIIFECEQSTYSGRDGEGEGEGG